MVWLSAAILVALFLLSSFFSGSETILFSLTEAQRMRIRRRNPAADRRIAACVGDSAMLLSTLNAPATKLVRVFNASLLQLLYALKAYEEKGGAK